MCGLQNLFSQLMRIHSDPPNNKKEALAYINDSTVQSQNKNEMFTVINEDYTFLRKAGFKAARDEAIFFLNRATFLGHVISSKGIQPTTKKIQKDMKNLNSCKLKRHAMKVLGFFSFYSSYIENLHVDSQIFYDSIKDSTPFHWTHEHEKLFQSIKDRINLTLS